MPKLRLILTGFILASFLALVVSIPIAGAKPSSEPFIQTTLVCGSEEIPALITPGGSAINFILPTSTDHVRVFIAVAASTVEQGTLFSRPAGALKALAETRMIQTCAFVGPESGRHFTVIGFFA
jgi:hypothetical protein